MNHYLDKELQQSIRDKMLRFDNRELVGKTVAAATYGGNVAGVSFTDGTWCAVEAVNEYDGADTHHVDSLDLHELRNLGLITEAQFAEAQSREQAKKRERKQKQLEQLQAELKSGRIT